jgi:hypothetical protein
VRIGLVAAEPILLLRRRIRETLPAWRLAYGELNLTPLNPTTTQPVIPRENILLIEAIHDLFVGSGPIEDLWHAWGQPDIWRLQHGHVSWACVPRLTGRVLRWLSPRLGAAAALAHSRTRALRHSAKPVLTQRRKGSRRNAEKKNSLQLFANLCASALNLRSLRANRDIAVVQRSKEKRFASFALAASLPASQIRRQQPRDAVTQADG